jgi:O-antigen/teichoic acid export membrane protein
VSRKLLRVGFLMTVVSVMGGAMGYVFQILMGRMLSPQEFALFAAIMSVAVVMTSPISAVFTVVSRNITQAYVFDTGGFVRKTYNRFLIINLVGVVVLVAIALFFASEISLYIKNSSGLQIALLAGVIGATSLGMLNNAYLQGGQKYSWLAGSGLSTVVLKILLAVSFVWVGFGVDGALVGVVASMIIANLVVMAMVKKSSLQSNGHDSRDACKVVYDLRKILPVLVANVSMSIMMQLDVLLVNNFFSSVDAGKYAAAATLGKAILYLPGGLVLALFPMVAEAQARASKVANYIITASGMTVAMCMVGIVFYWLAGEDLIRIFFGERYAGTEEILKYYSLAMLPMALLIVTEYFLMALGKVVYAWLSFIFAPLQIALIYIYHENLFVVIGIVGFSGLLLLVCGYLYLFRLIRVHLRQEVKV